MDHMKSIIFSCAVIAGAVVLSDHVFAGNAERGGPHARSWYTIDAGTEGVWAVSNEGALYFCRPGPETSKPICSEPVYPD
jgi:hypothetical protein